MNSTAHSLTLFRLKFFGSFAFIADPASVALHVRLAVHTTDATFNSHVPFLVAMIFFDRNNTTGMYSTHFHVTYQHHSIARFKQKTKAIFPLIFPNVTTENVSSNLRRHDTEKAWIETITISNSLSLSLAVSVNKP